MAGATRSVEIHTPIDLLYDVIVDYERYPEFVPWMTGARVLEREGERATVAFELDLIKRIDYVLELEGTRPTQLSWTLRDGRWMRRNDGCWELADLGSRGVRATYTIDLEFEVLVPRGIMTRLAGTNLPRTLEVFRERAESRANP